MLSLRALALVALVSLTAGPVPHAAAGQQRVASKASRPDRAKGYSKKVKRPSRRAAKSSTARRIDRSRLGRSRIKTTSLRSSALQARVASPVAKPVRVIASKPSLTPTRSFSKLPRLRRVAGQLMARSKLLAVRLITMPAHFWPFNRIAAVISHGEPFAGLSPRSAARVARTIADQGVPGVVIGRLSPSLVDPWSVRGAERSFSQLADELGAVKRAKGGFEAAIAYDPDSLGSEMIGLSAAERERHATDAMMRIARRAKAAGVGIEIDSTSLASLPLNTRIATKIAVELRVPVRLALAARFEPSTQVLKSWSALARRTGLPLGVRLVKGSYIENSPGTINQRKPLMASYKRLISQALEAGGHLDVAVATQNESIWRHAERESRRTGASYKVHVIRGVNMPLQAKMRKAGVIGAEYVSYGMDAPGFGLSEMATARKERRAIVREFAASLD